MNFCPKCNAPHSYFYYELCPICNKWITNKDIGYVCYMYALGHVVDPRKFEEKLEDLRATNTFVIDIIVPKPAEYLSIKIKF